jgi:hypothetical protein
MQKLAIALSFALMSSLTSAQAPKITRIDVTDVGVYDLNGSRLGVANNEQFVESTRTIHLRMGVHFGFRYSIVGVPDGAPVQLRTVAIYPPQGLHNPDVPNPIFRNERILATKIGVANSYRGVTLDHDWGLVPGDWTLEIWYGDQKLASETFTLIP